MRIALGVEYMGWGYSGFQIQKDRLTIQGKLEEALSVVANEPITIACAGRTDANVHALQQVIHFDTEVKRNLNAWTHGVNANLPATIAIKWATPVDSLFHARFSAISRRYRYIIYNHPVKSAFNLHRAAWCYYPLDIVAMEKASQYLLGEQDFTSFRSRECSSLSPMRNIIAVDFKKHENFIFFEIEANAFLHHMVRNIVGSLIRVGRGQEEPKWIYEVIKAKNRGKAGVTAEPQGLYLLQVNYPSNFNLKKNDLTFVGELENQFL